MAHPRKPPYRRRNFAKIFYTSQVIANFVPNFVAMATGVGRGKMRLAAFDGPSPWALSYCWSMMTMCLSCTYMEIQGFKDFGVTSLTFWGHVTVGLGICGFLLVVHWNHTSILHRYGDIGPQIYWGHDLDLLVSRDVIGHVTIRLGICGFLLVVHWNHASILNRYGDIKPQSCICPC